MNVWKSVAALIAGALASVAGSLYFQVWAPPTNMAIAFVIVILVLVVIILILYASDTKLRHRIDLWTRGRKTLIGILNDAGQVKGGTNSSCTVFNPLDWKQEIEQAAQADSLKVSVRLITTRNNFVPYSAILNPYGGAYPEPDASRLETLDKILEYVNEGGLFVNVADVPGYWAYNSRVNRIFETPQQTFVSGVAHPTFPFSLIPFTQKLGLEVYNVHGETGLHNWEGEFEERFSAQGKINLSVDRVAVIEKNVTPIMQRKTFMNKGVTPVFLANYGSGQCLISLLYLDNTINKQRNQGNFMKQKLAKILLDIVCKKK